MILSNIEIEKAIDKGLIVIDPLPDLKNMDTTSLDLRLGHILYKPKNNIQIVLEPKPTGIANTLQTLFHEIDLTTQEKNQISLYSGEFLLGQTLEKISLKIPEKEDGECYAARVEGKSSLARCGLIIHFTAPTIHAGFSGHITLEIMNLGTFPIILRYEMPICQLIFELVKGEIKKAYSQFHGQRSPTGSP